MRYDKFKDILNNLSLVSRVRFKNADGWTIFSVVRSFDGWIMIDQTGFINFRFTRTDPSNRSNEEAVDLYFSDMKNESYIGAVVIGEVAEVDFV